MQPARDEQEEFVRYRVLVGLPAGPPQAAAARIVPAGRHPGEQPARHIEVPHLAGQVVRRDPGQRPPAVVVVIQVAESAVDPLGPGERRLDDVPVSVLAGPLAVLDHGGQRIGGVPPARGPPQPGPRVVPALQCADGFAGPGPVLVRLLRLLRRHGYGVGAGPPGWLSGCPALKCSSAVTKVASVSQRVSELRGSRASVTHATAVYQGSDHGATSTQAKVSAQVAASTAGTSGDSRLYRYHASASSSSGHSTPISALIVAGVARWSPTIWNSRQNDGEMVRPDASGSGRSAFTP